ncbi:hypothetical protein BpHYR1_037635 [Brachionus plicatilis]|uniref:Uncharacterized protein n=1 Tax=Brachionus plicatilis TaxID=10195 RepID=A0A3M7P9T4_BRAPC|nr:hypothetical protein BpHYR1_037635 [Brachionus plicatilis]
MKLCFFNSLYVNFNLWVSSWSDEIGRKNLIFMVTFETFSCSSTSTVLRNSSAQSGSDGLRIIDH